MSTEKRRKQLGINRRGDIGSSIWCRTLISTHGRKVVVAKVPERHHEEKITLCTPWLRKHDEPCSGYCIWPAMAAKIRQVAVNCKACQLHKPRNQKETLKQHEEGETALGKIVVDVLEIKGTSYLVTVHYYSHFIEVDHLSTTTTKQVITKLRGQFARYGIPMQIMTDSGSQLLSREFKNFTKDWGVSHATLSPGHHK